MAEFTYDRLAAEEKARADRKARLASQQKAAAVAAGPKVAEMTEAELTRALTRGVFAGVVRASLLLGVAAVCIALLLSAR